MIARCAILSVLCALGTFIMLAAVVYEDPPAIIGFAFGILCGAGWMGVAALIVIRQLTRG